MAETTTIETDGANRRRFPRTSVLWAGQLMNGSDRTDCLVFNLSAGGARIRVNEPLELDTDCTLRIGQFGEFCGKVVWKAKNLLGISFSTDADEVGARLGATLPRCWQDAALA